MDTRIKPLSPTVLVCIFETDFEEGTLRWKERPRTMFNSNQAWRGFNGRHAGKEALCSVNKRGYKRGFLFGRNYLAHRVIWAMANGGWPERMIDHINGDSLDNRLGNLRQASAQQNAWNKRRDVGSKSKFKGASFHKATGKWRAYIQGDHIGLFKTEVEAARAYNEQALERYGEYARLNEWTAQGVRLTLPDPL